MFVGIAIDETIFDPNSEIRLTGGGGSQFLHRLPDAPPLQRLDHVKNASMPEKTITLRSLSQGPRFLLIADTDSSIRLDKCTFNGSGMLPIVLLEEVRGSIRAEHGQFHDQGIGISAAAGDVVLANYHIQLTSPAMAAISVDAATAMLATNMISAVGEGPLGIALTAWRSAQFVESRLSGVLGLTLYDGDVIAVTEDGLFGMEDGSLGGVMIIDLTEEGGLLIDPTEYGSWPEDVYSPVDFHNDPMHCVDYPPPQHDERGNGSRQGVPPPG